MRLNRVTLALLCGGLMAAAPAQAATYPDTNGSAFTADAEGWESVEASCSAASGSLVCEQENVHDPSDGNPPGSIVARTTVVGNAGGLLRGDSTWRSPAFVVGAEGAGVLEYDRRLEVGGIIALAPEAQIDVELVDQTTGIVRRVGREQITDADDTFVRTRVRVPADTLVTGRSYRVQLSSQTTTSTARVGVVGSADLVYDNVTLTVGSVSGPAGASGSAGVSFPSGPISSSQVSALASRLSLSAETGSGPGGSLVPLGRCTIVGTPGADRIRGSRGNDVICGLGGNDRINAGRGSDIIDGANGNDRVGGGAGADMLLGLRGRDRLGGSAGRDRLGGGAGPDRVHGGGGADRALGVSGNDRLIGGAGKDRLAAGAGRDRIAARDRTRDRVNGGKGRDRARLDRRRAGRKRADVARGVERKR